MRRREFVTLLGSAAAAPLLRAPVARAQEPGRIYRLGMMTGAPRQAPRMVAFFDELKTFRFVIIARSGHGPYIPCMPAILLARRLASGEALQRGAMPCVDLIDLDAFLAGLEGLDISVIRDAANV